MKLECLELEDFKSYSGFHRIGPFDSSFSCIVGPNGCGKSNLIDALLFIFGFKSTKLREDTMHDLIHRSIEAKAESCRVSVVFTNEGQKTKVGRAISKAGNSYYYMNDRKTTLHEIVVFLEGHSLDAKNGNFLILQGEVQQLAMSNPLGLMGYIEGLCGSNQYIQPLEELHTKIEDMCGQFQLFKSIYISFRDKIHLLESTSKRAEEYIFCQRKLLGLRERVFREKKLEIEGNIEKKEQRILNIVEEGKQVNLQNALALRHIEAECKRARLEAETLQMKRGEQQHKMRELQKILKREEKEWKFKQTDYTQVYNRRSNLEEQLAAFEKKDLSVQSQMLEEEIQQLNKEVSGCFTSQQLTQMTVVCNLFKQIDAKQCLHQETRQRAQLLEERLKEISTEQPQAVAKTIQKCKETIQQHKKRLEHLTLRQDTIRSSEGGIQDQITQLETISQKNQLQQRILGGRQEGTLPGVHGILNDKCYVDAKYDEALSAACPFLEYYLVDTQANAYKLIQFLKKQQLGRVSVIVMELVDTLELNRLLTRKFVPAEKGLVRLFDLVSVTEEKYRKFVYWSLRDTILVEDLEKGKRVAFGEPRQKVVTLRGQIIELSGLMCSVSKKIPESLDSLQTKKQLIFKEKESIQKEIESGLQAFEGQRSKLEGLEQKRANTRVLSEVEKQSQLKDYQEVRAEERSLEVTIEAVRQKIVAAGVSREEESSYQEINEKIKDLKAKVKNIKSPDNVIKRLKERIANEKAREAKLWDIYQEVERNKKELEMRLTEITEICERTASGCIHANAQLGSLNYDLKGIQDKIRLCIGEKERALDIRRLKEEVKNQTLVLEDELKKMLSCGAKLQQFDSFKEFSHDFKDITEQSTKASKKETLNRILSQKELGVGDVQLIGLYESRILSLEKDSLDFESIHEYISEREPFLMVERQYQTRLDLLESTRNQKQHLTTLRTHTFMTAYNKISSQLKTFYNFITEGGCADLSLVNSVNLFSAGVELSVKPVRKEWRRINSLSGGEKTLASFSLILACNSIMKCPFYFLDEIDAALDVCYVSRVADYIKTGQLAQFVVVSHRQQMYSQCNVMACVYKNHDLTKTFTFSILQVGRLLENPEEGSAEGNQNQGEKSNMDEDGD